MHLELTDLRLFIRAANEGSFTRAAQRQHLSLPAASVTGLIGPNGAG